MSKAKAPAPSSTETTATAKSIPADLSSQLGPPPAPAATPAEPTQTPVAEARTKVEANPNRNRGLRHYRQMYREEQREMAQENEQMQLDGIRQMLQAGQDANAEPEKKVETPVAEPAVTVTTPIEPNPLAPFAEKMGIDPSLIQNMKTEEAAKVIAEIARREKEKAEQLLAQSQKPNVQPEETAKPFSIFDDEWVSGLDSDQTSKVLQPINQTFEALLHKINELETKLEKVDDVEKVIQSTQQEKHLNAVEQAFASLPDTMQTAFGKGQVAQGSPEWKRRVAVLQSLQASPLKGVALDKAILQRTNELFGAFIPASPPAPTEPTNVEVRQNQWKQGGLNQPSAREVILDEEEKIKREIKKMLQSST